MDVEKRYGGGKTCANKYRVAKAIIPLYWLPWFKFLHVQLDCHKMPIVKDCRFHYYLQEGLFNLTGQDQVKVKK